MSSNFPPGTPGQPYGPDADKEYDASQQGGYPYQQQGYWGQQVPANPWHGHPQQYGQYGAPPPAPRPPKQGNNKWLLVGLPITLVIVLLAGVAVLVQVGRGKPSDENTLTAGEKDFGSGSVTDPREYWIGWPAGPVKHYSTTVPGFESGAGLTEAELARSNPRKLYWAMFKRQNMQRVTDYVNVQFETPQRYRNMFQKGDAQRFAVDYKNKEFLVEKVEILENGKQDPEALFWRCVDEQRWIWNPPEPVWDDPAKWEKDDDTICQETMKPGKSIANVHTSDGVASGGMTSEQADKFISYLDHINGLFTMGNLKMVKSKGGEQYIQLDVEVHGVDPKVEMKQTSMAVGAGFLNAAFAQTGHVPRKYPYSIDVGKTCGRVMRYYIDPQTLLPAYSVMKLTEPTYVNGKVRETSWFRPSYYLWQYSFPEQLPTEPEKHEGTPQTTWEPWPFEQIFLKKKTSK